MTQQIPELIVNRGMQDISYLSEFRTAAQILDERRWQLSGSGKNPKSSERLCEEQESHAKDKIGETTVISRRFVKIN